jgi:uncharacterized protein YciI
MYALAILRYLKPLADVLEHVDAHRTYLRGLAADGLLLASGPFEPRHGGALLLRLPDLGALNRVRDGGPFTKHGVAAYGLLPWRSHRAGKLDTSMLCTARRPAFFLGGAACAAASCRSCLCSASLPRP